MKVVIVSNSSSGLYNFRKELINKLIELGIDVIVMTALDERVEQLNSLGVRIIETEMNSRGVNPFRDISYMSCIKKEIKKEKPDLVITYTIKPNIYAGCICKKLHIPYVANVTGLGSAFNNSGLLKKIVTILNRSALKSARCVFFENSANMNYFVDNKIISKEQAVLLNGAGVNLDYFNYRKYPHNETFIFLFIGRIMKEKGIDELFEAMQRLHSEGYDCVLNVLGGYDESYKELISKYEHDGWLKYDGYQNDVRSFIEKCDCFVLPSYHEGMANTNLESASSGRPIITSDIPGCREAVINNVSGILCQSEDSDSLYSAMKKILLICADDRETMGREGRKHMENTFDKKSVVRKTIVSMGIEY